MLGLASTVIFGSESRRINDHNLLLSRNRESLNHLDSFVVVCKQLRLMRQGTFAENLTYLIMNLWTRYRMYNS
jgi:hypothetical protein